MGRMTTIRQLRPRAPGLHLVRSMLRDHARGSTPACTAAEIGGRRCLSGSRSWGDRTVMATFARRVLRAAILDTRIYEEVEADRRASSQAVGVVLLASVAGGIGLPGLGGSNPQSLVAVIIGSLVGWIAWAILTYLIGTRLLPEPQTKADAGELLRTIAFASAPGLLRVLGVVPFLGPSIYVIASLWMLLAMIVAVRQALDYNSTARAVGVCVVGWTLSLVVAAIIGNAFAPSVF